MDMKLSRLFKKDGWNNLFAGIGKKGTDKTKKTYYDGAPVLTDEELADIWIGEGLAKRIVSSVSNDMTKNWIEIPQDTDNVIMKELERLKAPSIFTTALNWTRLFRGGLIVLGTKEATSLEVPLSSVLSQPINYLKVYSAAEVRIDQSDFITDPKSEFYGEIEYFKVTPGWSTVEIKIHHSRCLVFKGESVPTSYKQADIDMKYWGMSALLPIWERLKNFGATEQGMANLMYEIVIGIFKLDGLAEILAENNLDAFYTRMETINSSKSLLNSVILGKDDDFTRNTANLSGIPEILDRMMMMLSSVTEIPVTRLFGRSPAGMNATGESDLTNYYDKIVAEQETKLKDPLQKLINIINTQLKVPGTPTLEFNPIHIPSQSEMLTMRKTQMEIDDKYMQTGVYTPEDVTKARFSEGGYSFDLNVEEI